MRLVSEIIFGGLKEAAYSPDDMRGARILLVEYDAPDSISAIWKDVDQDLSLLVQLR